VKLQAAIKYAEEDLPNAKVNQVFPPMSFSFCDHSMLFHAQTLVEQCASDDPDTEFNMGCVLFKVRTIKGLM